MTPIFFNTQADFRNWLKENHSRETVLIVGFYKVDSGKFNLSWSQSVDEALCFGWIDGVRRSIDEESYCIRFTPRKPGSNWSTVNIKKMEELIKNGKMQPAGLKAFSYRKEEKSAIYSFENDTRELSGILLEQFKANPTAWDFFHAQAPSYQKTMTHWILSAKQESTRLTRLGKLISESERQKRL